MKITRKQLRKLINEMAERDPRIGSALKMGHGEGPATPAVAKLINNCFLNGGAEGEDYLIGYAAVALEEAGYTVGKAGEVGELDVDIIVSTDEAAGTGMLYYPAHPKFQYSM